MPRGMFRHLLHPPTPIQQLVISLGGNTGRGGAGDPYVPAAWDTLARVTQSGGEATAIREARETAGLALTPANGSAAYDPSTGLITLDGSSGVLSTPSSSILDLSSPCSLAVVGTMAGASWYFALFGAGLLGMLGSGGFAAGAAGLQTNYAESTLADTDSTVRLFIVSNGGGQVNLDIPDQAEVSASQAQSSPGANALSIGYYQSAGGTPFMSGFYGAVFWTRVRTTADIAACQAYAATKPGYVPAT